MTALDELKQLSRTIKASPQQTKSTRVEGLDALRPYAPVDHGPAIQALAETMVQGFNLLAKAMAESEDQVTVNIDLDPLIEATKANTEAIKSLEEAYRAPRQIVEKNGRLGLKVG